MATILFAWELGGGLGHMMQILPLARALVKRGHRVYVVLREVAEAEAVFAGTGVCYLEAPHYRPGGRAAPFAVTRNFAHLLANVGWHDDRKLFALMCAWANLYALIKPDLVVFDHSPTALLASRGLPMRRAVIGSGFCVPPDESPWPPFRRPAEGEGDAARLAADEAGIRDRANRMLRHWGKEPLERLGQLYSQTDETFLTTFAELEQYPSRREAKYWGPVLPEGGAEPRWPQESRPLTPALSPGYRGEGERRVFAYLKRFAGLPELLSLLSDKKLPTVVYVDGIDAATRRKFESPSLRFERERVDLVRAAAECDLAILHAGQGATAAMLLAGKPVLQLPIVLEQRMTADAVVRLGAGERAAPTDPAAVGEKLNSMLASDRYAEAARLFAAKYADFDPAPSTSSGQAPSTSSGQAAQVERMAGRVEELLGGAAPKGPRRASSAPRVPAGVFSD